MRPEKAIVIVAMNRINQSSVIDDLIRDGICGRLAIKNSDNLVNVLEGENSKKISDTELVNFTPLPHNLEELKLDTSKVLYIFLDDAEKIEQIIEFSRFSN